RQQTLAANFACRPLRMSDKDGGKKAARQPFYQSKLQHNIWAFAGKETGHLSVSSHHAPRDGLPHAEREVYGGGVTWIPAHSAKRVCVCRFSACAPRLWARSMAGSLWTRPRRQFRPL